MPAMSCQDVNLEENLLKLRYDTVVIHLYAAGRHASMFWIRSFDYMMFSVTNLGNFDCSISVLASILSSVLEQWYPSCALSHSPHPLFGLPKWYMLVLKIHNFIKVCFQLCKSHLRELILTTSIMLLIL